MSILASLLRDAEAEHAQSTFALTKARAELRSFLETEMRRRFLTAGVILGESVVTFDGETTRYVPLRIITPIMIRPDSVALVVVRSPDRPHDRSGWTRTFREVNLAIDK